ncbi:MAG: preprotein translocase subunit SecY [Clostridia bacterium]|nr:preprotein translocase subunit SecY [Clostridia bacterium]
MIATYKNAFKIKDVRKKILWTLLLVFIYRVGCFIPVPGINASVITDFFASADTTNFLNIMSAITGGSLGQGALFAIGISPYINASIIMQLLTVAIPKLEKLSKEGEEGREKINKITRYLTIALAVVSSITILISLSNSTSDSGESLLNQALLGSSITLPKWVVFIFVMLVLTAGSTICMWLGERITDYGVSNGISLLIFIGIVSTAGNYLLGTITSMFEIGTFVAGGGLGLILFLAIVVVIFGFIAGVDKAERRIPVQYAKQMKGNKMYGGQSTFIPVKVNGSGVLPLIFAFALLSVPNIIISTFAANSSSGFVTWYNQYMYSGSVLYSVILAILIFAFAYFYSMITFNAQDISKNLQQNGGFVMGIRPGEPTGMYLNSVVKRITLYGAIFLAIMALVPSILFNLIGKSEMLVGSNTSITNLLSGLSATGMLIVVSVALEFDKSLEQQIMMRHYKGLFK